MIEFKEITEDNFYQVIDLELNETQAHFVASNVRSLAECFLYRHEEDVFPYAITDENTVIGFLLVYIDEEAHDITIWRMMIDKNYQGKGYGKQVLRHVIDYITTKTSFNKVVISVNPDNIPAYSLYQSFGFKDTVLNEHKEMILEFPIHRD